MFRLSHARATLRCVHVTCCTRHRKDAPHHPTIAGEERRKATRHQDVKTNDKRRLGYDQDEHETFTDKTDNSKNNSHFHLGGRNLDVTNVHGTHDEVPTLALRLMTITAIPWMRCKIEVHSYTPVFCFAQGNACVRACLHVGETSCCAVLGRTFAFGTQRTSSIN